MINTLLKSYQRCQRSFNAVSLGIHRSQGHIAVPSSSRQSFWTCSGIEAPRKKRSLLDGHTRTVPDTWGLTNKRYLWGWLNAIFNKVDENRIKEVGPDKACAEWLLRCGAFVKWHNRERWTKDYNSLPQTGGRSLKIEEIDATDSAIMHIGFPHFQNCKHIKRVIFHKAAYLDDAGMALLPLLKDSLKELQVSSCGNVTTDGLRHIKELKNLESLLLYDLPELENKETIENELKEALPNCSIKFPYALPDEYDDGK